MGVPSVDMQSIEESGIDTPPIRDKVKKFMTEDRDSDAPKRRSLYIRMQLSKDIRGVTYQKIDQLLYYIHKVAIIIMFSGVDGPNTVDSTTSLM